MNEAGVREEVKRWLGRVPLTAELAQRLRPVRGVPDWHYRVEALAAALPDWIAAAETARRRASPQPPRRMLVLGYLHWWLDYAAALGVLLAGLGHQVDLAFLPYRRWNHDVSAFDVRRQRAYLRSALAPLRRLVGVVDLAAGWPAPLPAGVDQAVERLSRVDVQYTGLRERIHLEESTPDRALLGLRLARNRAAAGAILGRLGRARYDVALIPNGSVLEFAAAYQAVRSAGVTAITYEFGEQRQRMWLAQNAEVMRLDTSALWQARGGLPLTETEMESLRLLYQARRGGRLWANFGRTWQAGQSDGADAVRRKLGIDPGKPVALLCTNVVGDSLALGRQIFTDGMADWLMKTVRLFAGRPQAQLVVRVHPAEKILVGDPSVDIVREAVPVLPEHVIVVPPESDINTYDLVEVADIGLAYTTTVGMEMAMAGIPVIVAGRAHYRGKGFTIDPETLDEYQAALTRLLEAGAGRRPSPDQVELAQRYAYRFFFEFPFDFPWHLVTFWDDVAERPPGWVLRPEIRERYDSTLAALLGEPIDWSRRGVEARAEAHGR